MYAQITTEMNISGWPVITTLYSPSFLFPVIMFSLILPVILELVNNTFVRGLSKFIAFLVILVVFICAICMGLAAFFVYEIKLIEYIV